MVDVGVLEAFALDKLCATPGAEADMAEGRGRLASPTRTVFVGGLKNSPRSISTVSSSSSSTPTVSSKSSLLLYAGDSASMSIRLRDC